MAENLLKDINSVGWKVFFNSPLIGDNKYTEQDKETIKNIAQKQFNYLALNDDNFLTREDNEFNKMIMALWKIAEKSSTKELDFLFFMAKDDQQKITAIKNIYTQLWNYFSELKIAQIPNINFNQEDLKVLNAMFWSNPEEKDSTGQSEFIKALSAMRAQDFFINGAASRIQRLGESTSNSLVELDFDNWYKNNIFSGIVDFMETDEKYKKSALADLKAGGKRLRASVGAIKTHAGKISKILTETIIGTAEKELEKTYNEAIKEAIDKGAKIPEELKNFSSARKQAKYNGANTRSLFAQYNISLTEEVVKIVAVSGTAFTADSLASVLVKNITNKLPDNDFMNEQELKTFFKDIVKQSIDSLEVHFGQTIKVNIDGVIKKITEDETIIDILDNFFLSAGTSEDDIKKFIENLKKDINNQLNNLVQYWIQILDYEIPSIRGVDNEKVLKYFNTIKDDLKRQIKEDLKSEESSLEGEILKAVSQYYKISWGSSGQSGHVALFNGTIGEIFATYLLRKVLGNNAKVYQRGSSLQEGKQAIADVEIQYSNKKIGLQLKQYRSNSIDLYGEEQKIPLISASRYLTQEEIDSFMFLLGNYPTLSDIGSSLIDKDFSQLLPFLYYRLDGFLRTKHATQDLIEDLQNNFYIFNFNVIPTSIIYLYYAFRIREECQIMDKKIEIKKQSIFKIIGSTEQNDFGPKIAYNLFDSSRSTNLLSKMESFKIIFKGKTINIDDKESRLSIFMKR